MSQDWLVRLLSISVKYKNLNINQYRRNNHDFTERKAHIQFQVGLYVFEFIVKLYRRYCNVNLILLIIVKLYLRITIEHFIRNTFHDVKMSVF